MLKKILFFIPELSGGGAERVVLTLLRHLDRTKFHPILAVIDTSNIVYQEDIPLDIEFIDLKCSGVRHALPKIIWLIWKKRPHVVFSTLSYLNLAIAIVRPILPNDVRYLAREVTNLSHLLSYSSKKKIWLWTYARIYRYFYSKFDVLICQSKDMQEDIVKNFFFPKNKTKVINNPVDVKHIIKKSQESINKKFFIAENNNGLIHLVSAGRLIPLKAFDLLINALKLCDNPKIHLTILGEGPLQISLENLAQEIGISHQVSFIGFQKNPYAFFTRAHAFVLSSRFEGFPNVVLEALACGIPVIATPIPSVKEIIGNIEGCIVLDSITAEALSKAIQTISEKKFIPNNVIDPYAVKKITAQYEELFI